jgi:hypothetical protein
VDYGDRSPQEEVHSGQIGGEDCVISFGLPLMLTPFDVMHDDRIEIRMKGSDECCEALKLRAQEIHNLAKWGKVEVSMLDRFLFISCPMLYWRRIDLS